MYTYMYISTYITHIIHVHVYMCIGLRSASDASGHQPLPGGAREGRAAEDEPRYTCVCVYIYIYIYIYTCV